MRKFEIFYRDLWHLKVHLLILMRIWTVSIKTVENPDVGFTFRYAIYLYFCQITLSTHIFFSSSETVIFLNLVTTISCQITTPKIGFIGLLIILLILRLLVLKKMLSINASKALIFNDFKNCLNFSFKKISNWKFVSKEQKSVWSKSLRRKQITQNVGRTKLVESILIGNEIATILGNCPTIFDSNIENKIETIPVYFYVIIIKQFFHAGGPTNNKNRKSFHIAYNMGFF